MSWFSRRRPPPRNRRTPISSSAAWARRAMSSKCATRKFYRNGKFRARTLQAVERPNDFLRHENRGTARFTRASITRPSKPGAWSKNSIVAPDADQAEIDSGQARRGARRSSADAGRSSLQLQRRSRLGFHAARERGGQSDLRVLAADAFGFGGQPELSPARAATTRRDLEGMIRWCDNH